MNVRELENLGDPDLVIAGFQLWVHGREYPQATDYWDGNWLRITAYCVYPNSMVRTHGPIVHLGEIAALLRGCEHLYQTLKGEAGLVCMEPYLNAELVAETGGKIKVKLSITPDHMSESHSYSDSFDQTYLPPIIAACRAILASFPAREAERLPT
ncbi:MAG: hypothetical protein PHP85_06545 [Gallionella sp.]|nr:hypothetical protein [Gallionella sp.]